MIYSLAAGRERAARGREEREERLAGLRAGLAGMNSRLAGLGSRLPAPALARYTTHCQVCPLYSQHSHTLCFLPQDVEKVTALLHSLASRLARTEAELAATTQPPLLLSARREKLQEQLKDAQYLQVCGKAEKISSAQIC